MAQDVFSPLSERPIDEAEVRRRLAACYRLLLSLGTEASDNATPDSDVDDATVASSEGQSDSEI